MTSYIWFYTYVHKEHGWSTTPARKPGSLPGPISKEGLGWGVLPSPPSQLPLKPPHCTFSTSISETPAPALRHRNPGWVKLAVQPFPPPQFFPLYKPRPKFCVPALPLPERCWLEGYPAVTAHRCGPFPCPQPPRGKQDPAGVPRLSLVPGSPTGMRP